MTKVPIRVGQQEMLHKNKPEIEIQTTSQDSYDFSQMRGLRALIFRSRCQGTHFFEHHALEQWLPRSASVLAVFLAQDEFGSIESDFECHGM